MAGDDKDAGPYQQRGSDAVRDTAKWVAVALASVGAAIIAGLQLADLRNLALPELNPQLRMILAGGGVILGLGGVGVAIRKIADVLTPQHLTLERLVSQTDYAAEKAFFAANKEFLRGFGSTADELKTNYKTLHQQYIDARTADAAASTTATQTALAKAAARFKAVHDTLLEVLRVAAYEHLRRLFLKKLTPVFVCACVAALGGTLFAWATAKSPQGDQTSLFADRVTIELPPATAQPLQADLGPNCDTKSLDAVILADADGALDALVLPVNQCTMLRLAIPAGMAKVRAKTMIDRKSLK